MRLFRQKKDRWKLGWWDLPSDRALKAEPLLRGLEHNAAFRAGTHYRKRGASARPSLLESWALANTDVKSIRVLFEIVPTSLDAEKYLVLSGYPASDWIRAYWGLLLRRAVFWRINIFGFGALCISTLFTLDNLIFGPTVEDAASLGFFHILAVSFVTFMFFSPYHVLPWMWYWIRLEKLDRDEKFLAILAKFLLPIIVLLIPVCLMWGLGAAVGGRIFFDLRGLLLSVAVPSAIGVILGACFGIYTKRHAQAYFDKMANDLSSLMEQYAHEWYDSDSNRK